MKMLITTLVFILVAVCPTRAQTQGISTTLLDRFIQMATICMSTYVDGLCLFPGGLPIVATITNDANDIHGWILRDDSTQELITVFRGTESIQNYETDTNYTLADFDTFPSCVGCQVHGGYYVAWAAVVDDVQSLLQAQAAQYPNYGIVITGHRYFPALYLKIFMSKLTISSSLGGSLAALAAAQFSPLFGNMTIYTMGEPRTGNAAFASFIDNTYQTSSPDTTKFYRCTHENDGIPLAPPTSLGYVHHGLEYWNLDPTSTSTTYICGAETTECCGGQNGSGINAAHLTYWGRTVIIGGQCL
jgi:hypothetical protein